jgi:hypothetical protein
VRQIVHSSVRAQGVFSERETEQRGCNRGIGHSMDWLSTDRPYTCGARPSPLLQLSPPTLHGLQCSF